MIQTLTELAQALDAGKVIEIKTTYHNTWERFDHDSYVLRDIKRFIKDGKLRIKES